MAKPKQFVPGACETLRRLKKTYDAAERKKQAAVKNRDKLQDDIAKCNAQETRKLEHLKAACFDELEEIKRCNNISKATTERAWEVIGEADQHQLFGDGLPVSVKTIDEPFFVDEKESAEEDETEE